MSGKRRFKQGSHNVKDWQAEAWAIVHEAMSPFLPSIICADILKDGWILAEMLWHCKQNRELGQSSYQPPVPSLLWWWQQWQWQWWQWWLLSCKAEWWCRFCKWGNAYICCVSKHWSWGSTVDTSSVNRLQDDGSILKTPLLYYYNGTWTIGTCHMSTQQ